MNKKELYDKASSMVSMDGVIDGLIASLRTAITDAKNQAENGSNLGMAVAVGSADAVLDDLVNAWEVVKAPTQQLK